MLPPIGQVSAPRARNKWDIAPLKWDLALLPDESRAGVSAWTDTFPARALGAALAAHREFLLDVRAGRADPNSATRIARRYIRRNQGRRLEIVEFYLRTAADAEPASDERYARMRLWNIGNRAWFPDSEVTDPDAPQRAEKKNGRETILRAAVRVARRGANRCAEPGCSDGEGAILSRGTSGDYCAACVEKRSNAQIENPTVAAQVDVGAEKRLFDAIAASLFDADSGPRKRRRRQRPLDPSA